jgi:GT2 family glycosyltransferase
MKWQISIIIPTHNRRYILLRTLTALARQTIASTSFEVIVVADGCHDGTAAFVRSLSLPYRLTLIEQPGAGAASARNCGAAAAMAPLLLFLDDDMEAAPELIAAHLAIHTRHSGAVVLGKFPIVGSAPPYDFFQQSYRRWWDAQFDAQARPHHRFTYRDFCTGNVSLPRALFDVAGGFDSQFRDRAGEDYDLGVRLLRLRARFHFAPEALSIHHDVSSQRRSFQRATDEGRGHVLMAQKYPELFTTLPLSRPEHSLTFALLFFLLWRKPALAARLASVLEGLLSIASAIHQPSLWRRVYGVLHAYAYWRGVRTELGSLAAYRQLAQDAPLEPPNVYEIEIDLATDLERLDEILAPGVDALRMRFGAKPLGRIAPTIGAEALRPEHVRMELATRFGGAQVQLASTHRSPSTLCSSPGVTIHYENAHYSIPTR